MNDNMTLIAAATGGLMLSVALSGILKGAPITDWQQVHKTSYPIANVQVIKKGNG
ncbi:MULTISPECIES: hypothetical protein [Aphanizomenonaceae]|uniref:Uncharacterized protein n=1 Tax=Dolichospermum heterosporum TAC447 TaxID=747523 RepID=A0ABY5LW99_9CYAN|nr:MULTISPECIES: hypothetical protein [Aphanizomenonaceae]MBE9259010.1 hypothetical protein [Dolichospermum sp. LEGE 00246]MDK2410830.1 hypothetical protein [Aphanizomenon sp. 202]MDK2462885.1 hypothetical protein [Aphanizomenon sp. PH219]UUO14955.1 hypothetical protein NG743_23580 [Dolichospermum heterosporum TAC447]